MAQVVGIFQSCHAVDAMIEQLHLNGITQVVVMRPDGDMQAQVKQFREFGVPYAQLEEYRTRLHDQRCLLFVQISALDLPTVQRAFRSSQALNIDLLPDSGA
jgi:hypothetical protein